MLISTCLGGVTGYPQGLSTRTGLFSTRYRQALHVRELDFVRLFHKCTYRGTGADSRVGLASAPAFPIQVAVKKLSEVLPLVCPAAFSRPSQSCSSVSVTV
jgi:hypothetical protein